MTVEQLKFGIAKLADDINDDLTNFNETYWYFTDKNKSLQSLQSSAEALTRVIKQMKDDATFLEYLLKDFMNISYKPND